MPSDIGVIGLGTMGSAYARNLASHGSKVSVWNRSTEKITAFVDKFGESFYAPSSIEDFIQSLSKPRKMVLLVPAGPATEAVIDKILPLLEEGDTIMDGANQHYKEAERFQEKAAQYGVALLSAGISGGEEGALKGPSIMPGGSEELWKIYEPFLVPTAADDFNGGPCVAYMGKGSAGQYVKMVHNGIEYAEMQALAEAYQMLREIYQLSYDELSEIFQKWDDGPLGSFLNEISVDILKKKEDGQPLLELILDKAGQKGTGRWTSEEALALGVPMPSITGAVFMRGFSAAKEERSSLEERFQYKKEKPELTVQRFVTKLEKSLLASRIANFEQGFALLRAADEAYEFGLNYAEITRIWEGGCIIQNKLLPQMTEHFKTSKASLYTAEFAQSILNDSYLAWKELVQLATHHGIPILAISGALTHFESMRRARGSANFIQGLRDRFGAHTYERIDKEGKFHSKW